MSTKVLACVAGAIGLAAGGAAFLWFPSPPVLPPPSVRQVAEPRASPSLHCLFSDFTHASVVVGFDFAVALQKGAQPQFAERAEAFRNDPAVTFEANDRPRWLYAVDEDGFPTITSPDGATRILLYGLKPGARDGSWLDAGIRSNTFRNLDGKCLQTHFGDTARDDVTETVPR